MANPNSDASQGVGQGRPAEDMTQEYDSRHGTYDGGLAKTAKPTSGEPGPLPNTPSPIKTTGG